MLRKKRSFKIKKAFFIIFFKQIEANETNFFGRRSPSNLWVLLLNFIVEKINQFQSNFNVKDVWSLAEIQGQNLGSEYP